MENANSIIANTCRVPEFGPFAIASLMYELDMEERAFAILMNVEPMTVRLWLNGVTQPSGTARRLMQIYRDVPCILDCLSDGDMEDDDEY